MLCMNCLSSSEQTPAEFILTTVYGKLTRKRSTSLYMGRVMGKIQSCLSLSQNWTKMSLLQMYLNVSVVSIFYCLRLAVAEATSGVVGVYKAK